MADDYRPSADLLFWQPWTGSADLVFGAGPGDGAPAAQPAQIGGDVSLPLAIDGRVGIQIRVGGAVDLALPITGSPVYDANVDHTAHGWARQSAQPAAPVAAAARSTWRPSAPLRTAARHRAQPGLPLPVAARAHWQTTRTLEAAARHIAQLGQSASIAARASFQRTITLCTGVRATLQPAAPIALLRRAGIQAVIVLRAAARQHLQPGAPIAAHWPRGFARAQPMPQWYRSRLQPARPPVYASHPPPPIVLPDEPLCYCPATLADLVFRDPYTGSADLLFVCRPCVGTGPIEPEQPSGLVVVARRRSYIVINDLQIRTVPAGDLLPALDSGFSMQLEQGSWTWGVRFSAHASALPLLQPDAGGDPVELEVTVNGQPIRMLVESIARSVKFPRAVVNVSGRGLAALLDAPRAPVQSFAQPADVSAQQLALDVLTVNGVSMGWQVDWQLTDWQIPAGSWAHQGTWISAITDIAAAVGGYVQPHDTAHTLRILPAWPVAAWELAGATPDIELPPGIATVEEVTWADKPAYDALYMQGEPGLKLYYRKRTGTAGANPAPMAVHSLLVDSAAAQQRAIAALSDTGRQIEQRLQLAVLPATGIIKPGVVLRYTDDADAIRTGIVRATQVTQSGPRIEQAITVQAPA